MKRFAYRLFLLFFLLSPVFGQQTAFEHVKIHRHKSPQDRMLVDKSGVLTFDDTRHALTFKDDAGDKLDIAYSDVTKVIFEVTSHMRGGALAQVIGGVAGSMIAAKHVNDYWLYLEHKTGAESVERTLMEVEKDSSSKVIDKANEVFGSRVAIEEFPEVGAEIDKASLKDLQSKHELKVNKQNHPLPEIKPDEALVVVVCPALAARYAGKGNQFKLHANDRVIAVNRMGTYSFAYLQPGKYRLVSQSENANGFDMELEGGKDYYFLQNTFMGAWKARTALSHDSKELVMYELDGSHFSDWKRKGPEAGK